MVASGSGDMLSIVPWVGGRYVNWLVSANGFVDGLMATGPDITESSCQPRLLLQLKPLACIDTSSFIIIVLTSRTRSAPSWR